MGSRLVYRHDTKPTLSNDMMKFSIGDRVRVARSIKEHDVAFVGLRGTVSEIFTDITPQMPYPVQVEFDAPFYDKSTKLLYYRMSFEEQELEAL